MDPTQIRALTLIEVRDAIARGELTSEAATKAALEQAQRFDADYALFITLTPELAMEQALAADRARQQGQSLGPLHGVPITVKDNIDTAGILTTAGAKVLKDRVPSENATAVDKVFAAGAVMLGKTNLHEMALGGTSTNPHYGAVRNPWDPSRIPGGSSGGSAAAQSLQIGYASLGTDSAGSVRMPASLCGLVGLKQTHGIVSLKGCVPTGTRSTDHIGPMTRTVADSALMLSVMQGYDPGDPDSTPRMPDPYPPLDNLQGLTVGIPETYFWEELDPEVEAVCRRTVDIMQAAGAQLVPVALETLDLMPLGRLISAPEWLMFHEPYLQSQPEDYGEDIRYRLMMGRYMLATDYVRAARARRLFVEDFSQALRQVDVMVMPTMSIPAHTIGATTVSIGGVETPLYSSGNPMLIRNTYGANQAGVPAISLPAGFTSQNLPVGIQFVAAAFQDHKLLSIASVMERLLGVETTPPIVAQALATV